MQSIANLSQHPTSSLHPNSLITGQLTGNFADSGPPARFSRPVGERIQWLAAKFPYAMEQGIFGGLTGNSIEGSGKLVSVNFSHTCFGVCRTRSVLPSILQMRRTRWRTRS